MFKKLFFSLLRIVFAVLIGFTVLLYFSQEQMLFPRKQLDEGFALWARQQFPQAELKITAPDGTKLHGWFIQRKTEEKQPLLIYFGGNATEATVFLSFEEVIFQDALYLYDLFSKNPNIDPNRIYVMGRSLGTGVATYLASQRQIKGTILISPYESILALAKEQYQVVPVEFLLKHRFESIKYAPHIKTPALVFVGLIDEVISPDHSDRLVEKWGGEIKKITFPLANHNSIMDEKLLWKTAAQFVN